MAITEERIPSPDPDEVQKQLEIAFLELRAAIGREPVRLTVGVGDEHRKALELSDAEFDRLLHPPSSTPQS